MASATLWSTRIAKVLLVLIATLGPGLSNAQASILTLYDGASGGTPDQFTPQQLTFFTVGGGTENYSPTEQATQLQTTNLQYAGYSNFAPSGSLVNPNFPVLDRVVGYQIRFTMNLLAESRTNNDRAGFSVLAVSSDAGSGVLSSIEIGIQGDRVFSQETGFTAGESAAFNALSEGYVDYELSVVGTTYRFTANGTELLTGSLRDYTSWDSGGLPDPYEIPNFIFFGDNTTSASADLYFKSAHLVQPVPEPSALLILTLCLGSVVAFRLRGQRRQRA